MSTLPANLTALPAAAERGRPNTTPHTGGRASAQHRRGAAAVGPGSGARATSAGRSAAQRQQYGTGAAAERRHAELRQGDSSASSTPERPVRRGGARQPAASGALQRRAGGEEAVSRSVAAALDAAAEAAEAERMGSRPSNQGFAGAQALRRQKGACVRGRGGGRGGGGSGSGGRSKPATNRGRGWGSGLGTSNSRGRMSSNVLRLAASSHAPPAAWRPCA